MKNAKKRETILKGMKLTNSFAYAHRVEGSGGSVVSELRWLTIYSQKLFPH